MQNDRDAIRNVVSSLENSETQSEGDEFLQPKSRAPLPPSGLSSLGSMSPSPTPMKLWPSGSHMTSDGSCAPQNQHNWHQERLRYAQTHGLDPNTLRSVSNSDGSSLRYCPDSMKADSGSDEYDSARSQAQVGTLKLELPVDEEDYLMPSPQQSQMGRTYVDLIDSKDGSSTNIFPAYAVCCRNHVDNPEYLMGNDAPSQTIGIPTVSELVQASSSSRPCSSSNPTHQPQRSSEEESEPEYYNDFDRLQRELQPLQKKEETTV